MRDLYNKSALDKISSQTGMNKMVRLVSPSIWVSIIGALLIIGALAVWGFKGNIPTSLTGSGIYMNTEGLSGQYAASSGVLVELCVRTDDEVKKGDVLAVIADDEYYRLSQLDDRIAHVENMTFDSEWDDVTSDTEQMAELKRQAKSTNSDYEATQTSIDIKKEGLARLGSEADAKKEEMIRYKEMYYSTLAIDNSLPEFRYSESEQDYENSRSGYESAKNSYLSAEMNYYQLKKQFDGKYRNFSYEDATEEEQRAYDEELGRLQAAADSAEDYSILLEDAEDNYDDANSHLDNARTEYLQVLDEASGTNVENSIAYTEYSELLNQYNTLLAEYRNLSGEISELEIKLVVDQFNELRDYENYNLQFDNEKAAVLSQLENEREDCLNDIEMNNVVASRDGIVYRIDLEPGAGVTNGTKIMSIKPQTNVIDNGVVCYVPYTEVAEIKLGQEVHLTPTGLNSNEYGFIYGKVESINDYLESYESMLETFGSDDLIRQFTSNGAVVAVTCSLEKDPNSRSGYNWSSEKGDEKIVYNGDMMDAVFITDSKRPIDVLIPYVKDKLDFKEKKDD